MRTGQSLDGEAKQKAISAMVEPLKAITGVYCNLRPLDATFAGKAVLHKSKEESGHTGLSQCRNCMKGGNNLQQWQVYSTVAQPSPMVSTTLPC